MVAQTLMSAASRLIGAPGARTQNTGRDESRSRRQECLRHAVAAVVLIALGATGCSRTEQKEVEAPAPVQVTAVTQDTVRRIVNGDGTLFPLHQENAMPKIQAPVLKYYANRGDHVKAGQLLATLENRDLKAGVSAAKANLDQQESNLRNTTLATLPEAVVKAATDVQSAQQQLDAAQKMLESRRDLLAQGALARRQVDEAQVQYAQARAALETAQEHQRALNTAGKLEQVAGAQAQVDNARAQLQSAQAQLSFSEVTSPIAGVIADRPVYPGDMASPGSPLFIVMDISRVVARVNVSQNDAPMVRVGQDAEITITGSDAKMAGKVTVVSPATDPNTTTVQVWVEADNRNEQFKPGVSVRAQIVAQIVKAVPVVPASAILPGEEGGTAVLVVSSDSVAHLRLVRLGIREGNKVQILSGANPGEDVVVVGGLGVEDKAKVKVVDTSVKEADDEDENNPEPPPAAPAGKDQKKDEAKPKSK